MFVEQLFFFSDGSKFISVGNEKMLKIWSFPDFKFLMKYDGKSKDPALTSVTLVPSGNYMLYGGRAVHSDVVSHV